MQTRHGVPAERIRTIYNGIDLDRFSPSAYSHRRPALRRQFGVGDNEILIIALAQHARLKGIPVLIRVIKQLRSQGAPVKLLLCGGDKKSDRPALEQGGTILRCGNVQGVAQLYAAADICVHPTFYDACSLVTLEALASGLPVVTTRANGASELITSGVNGLVLAQSDNSNALACLLLPLIESAELRRAFGLASRQLMNTHSAEQNYRDVVAVYMEVLKSRSIEHTPLDPKHLAA